MYIYIYIYIAGGNAWRYLPRPVDCRVIIILDFRIKDQSAIRLAPTQFISISRDPWCVIWIVRACGSVFLYIYKCIRIHYVLSYMYTDTFMCTCTYVYVYTHICTHIIYMYIYVYMYTCIYIYTCVYIHIYTYIYTYVY